MSLLQFYRFNKRDISSLTSLFLNIAQISYMERSRSIFNPLRYVEANQVNAECSRKERDKKTSNTTYAVTDIDVINVGYFFIIYNKVSDEI